MAEASGIGVLIGTSGRAAATGQGTASVFHGRDAPAPSVMLRSLPARR